MRNKDYKFVVKSENKVEILEPGVFLGLKSTGILFGRWLNAVI